MNTAKISFTMQWKPEIVRHHVQSVKVLCELNDKSCHSTQLHAQADDNKCGILYLIHVCSCDMDL